MAEPQRCNPRRPEVLGLYRKRAGGTKLRLAAETSPGALSIQRLEVPIWELTVSDCDHLAV